MHKLLSAAALSLTMAQAFAAAPAVPTFTSEEAAQIQCPLDKVVWLEPKTHRYYFRSSKHYANSGTGGFACLKVVKAAGNRPGDKK